MARHKFNRRDLKEARQKSAAVRLEERGKRSAKDQIAELDRILGVGIGAVRERSRLQKLISG